MTPNDILGLGKMLPLDKLVDVVAKAMGRISKQYFDRKDIETKVYEIKRIAEARAEEMKIISSAVKENFQLTGGIEYKDEKLAIISPKELQSTFKADSTLEERSQERISFQEAKKQLNIENVTGFAAEELKDEEPINDQPLDEDWTTRFFKIVEDVSNEEMQALWGKILAGEIKQPQSFSLRTLELIRNLTRQEAEIFIKIANFSITLQNIAFIYKGKDEELSKNFDVHYSEIVQLIEIGIIQPGDFVNWQLVSKEIDVQSAFVFGNIAVVATKKANSPLVTIPINLFTKSGYELLKLVGSDPPFEYLKSFAMSIKSENIDVKYAQIEERTQTQIRFMHPLVDFS